MSANQRKVRRGSLWQRIVETSRHAQRVGAVQPIRTEERFIEDGGVRFVVRIVSALAAKPRPEPQQQAAASPFLPHDPSLFVSELCPTHVCLLNKFNVIDHHLLIVTRHFEPQEALLNDADFQALFACLAEVDGLGFYNGGTIAGASQSHKHLQLVPLPLAREGPPVPMAPLLATAGTGQAIARIAALPFANAFARLDPALIGTPHAAKAACERYRAMLGTLGITAIEPDGRQSAPYNLLLSREWMLLVPRSQECFHGISVNALGFAGSLFVRSADELAVIEAYGPMRVLQNVAVAG